MQMCCNVVAIQILSTEILVLNQCLMLNVSSILYAFMHLSILCSTTPSHGQCQGRGGDLNYAKFKSITYWPCQSVKSKHSSQLGDFIANVYTFVHVYGEWSNTPYIGEVLVSNWSQMSHLSPYIAREEGSEHNVDRCITHN